MNPKGQILIIDDSEIVLSQLKSTLEGEGYRVVTTAQTVGAGRFLRGTDLVVLDFHMPGMDGSDVLNSLQAASRSMDPQPLFYVYTTDKTIADSYRSLGFDGAFGDKGDATALLRQVQAAFRLVRIRRRS